MTSGKSAICPRDVLKLFALLDCIKVISESESKAKFCAFLPRIENGATTSKLDIIQIDITIKKCENGGMEVILEAPSSKLCKQIFNELRAKLLVIFFLIFGKF